MKYIFSLLGFFGCTCACLAADQTELVVDIPAAVSSASNPAGAAPLSWIHMEASVSTSSNAPVDNSRRTSSRMSARELLNKVSVGAWKWENGTSLRLSGDRFRLSYGDIYRINFTVRPFKNTDTVALTVNRNF